MRSERVDVSLVVTFHNEGLYAHSTLNSIERCCNYSRMNGVSVECVFVLDSVDDETKNVFYRHSIVKKSAIVVEVESGDVGAARNIGIKKAAGSAVAILDGDDYYSKNWIERAWNSLSEYGDKAIIHPECMVTFGNHREYCWQVDQSDKLFSKDGLLVYNYWSSWTFARRNVYISHPYGETRPLETGFGYEDWHWNCEMVAKGYEHRLAPGTVGFYRRKANNSLAASSIAAGAIIKPSSLFAWRAV